MEKKITFNPSYTVDEEGNIYSYKHKNKHKMSPYLDGKKRYYMIDLSNNGKRVKCLVHRLVAQAFIPNPNNLPEVDHIDNNPRNNSVNNLRWCDRKFNLERSYKTMSPTRNYKITELFYNDEHIGYFKSTKLACKYAAQKYNISSSSLEKYKKSGKAIIKQIDVTTIETINIITNIN